MEERGNHDFTAIPNFIDNQRSNIASELIGQDNKIKKKFFTLTRFRDDDEAVLYAQLVAKAQKYNDPDGAEFWQFCMAAKCSVGGWRSMQIVDVLTQIQRIAEEEKARKRAQKIEARTNS